MEKCKLEVQSPNLVPARDAIEKLLPEGAKIYKCPVAGNDCLSDEERDDLWDLITEYGEILGAYYDFLRSRKDDLDRIIKKDPTGRNTSLLYFGQIRASVEAWEEVFLFGWNWFQVMNVWVWGKERRKKGRGRRI